MAQPPSHPPRPADVHIEDLGNPQLPAEVRSAIAAMEPIARALDWSADGVCRQAMQETGLSDFGSRDFRARLARILDSLEREAGLNAMGRTSRFATLTRYAKNRLLLEALYRRHPEIEREKIARPIVIAGLPRTGTTHLHNLMSADPALRSLPYWEALEPIPDPREPVAPGAIDPRRARCEASLAPIDLLMPYFERMHEMSVDYVHEEIELLAIDFSTMFFENLGCVPSWRDAYRASDQTPHYRYLKRILKALQWLRGPERWVLKSPQHLEQLVPLYRVFPDAITVVTHRDPVSIVASFATMICYGARLSEDRPDLRRHGHYWKERIKDLLLACVRDRDEIPAAQSVDIRFHELVGRDVEWVERIYGLAGQPLPPTSRAAIERYMATHPQGLHGRVIYRLEDFGLDAAALREEFRPYTERFGVRLES
jgi:hypothetical protein